jgi:MFS family permease
VLINVYHQPANSIAKLLMIAAFIGLFFKPFVGYLIDRFGERVVLIADGIVLILVCLGYGYALWLLEPKTAGILAGACFIGDNLLFALGAGRAIYVSRITDSKTELTSTLAMGVSINHVVSMTIPLVGGAIWTYIGFESVFLGAAFLALTISIVACFLPKKINLPA